MADLADLLSTIYARAQQVNQWPNVHRATAFAPFELGHKVSKESKTSNISSNLSSNFSSNEGYGRIGEALGKGINDAIMGFYVNPKMEANAERIKWETSPSMLMKRAQAAMEHIRTLPPDQQALAMQSPEMQSLAQAAKKYAPWLVGEQGFNMPQRTIEEERADIWRGMPQGYKESEVTLPVRKGEADIRAKGAESAYHEAGADKTRTEIPYIGPSKEADLIKTQAEIKKILADIEESKMLAGPKAGYYKAVAADHYSAAQARLQKDLANDPEDKLERQDARTMMSKYMTVKGQLQKAHMADQLGDDPSRKLNYLTEVSGNLPGMVYSLSNKYQLRAVVGEGIDIVGQLVNLSKSALQSGNRKVALEAYNQAMYLWRTYSMSGPDAKGNMVTKNPIGEVYDRDLNTLYDQIVGGKE